MEDQPLRFLLIEDNDQHAKLVVANLERQRVLNRVDRVADGEQAIQFLRQEGAYADCPRPDVLLLDLSLPKLDGHQVLATIKKDPRLASIPVVILSTSDSPEDRRKAYELGANSYLVKPLDFDRFRQMVQDLNFYWGVWNRPAPERELG